MIISLNQFRGVPLNDNIFKSISLTIWKALYTLIRQKLPFGTFLYTLWNGFENLSNHWELALSLSISLSLWFDKPIQNFCSYFLICGPLAWIFFLFFFFLWNYFRLNLRKHDWQGSRAQSLSSNKLWVDHASSFSFFFLWGGGVIAGDRTPELNDT